MNRRQFLAAAAAIATQALAGLPPPVFEPPFAKRAKPLTAWTDFMVSEKDLFSPWDGVGEIAAFVSRDRGLPVKATNEPQHIGNGFYKLNLTPEETDANVLDVVVIAEGACPNYTRFRLFEQGVLA